MGKPIDATHIYKNYRGKWVAVKTPTDMTVVASGKTLMEASKKAEEKGFDHPVYMQIPKKVLPIIGIF